MTEPVLQVRSPRECSNHIQRARAHIHTHTHATVTGSSKVFHASGCDKSFLFKKHSQPSRSLPYFDITTCRCAQNQARSDRRNAEEDAGRKRKRLRQAAARAARRYPVTPAGLTCCDESSLQPTYMHTHTHTQQTTPPALLPFSISALARRAGLLMPSPGRLSDSNDSPHGERQPARGLPHGDSYGVDTKLQQLVLCSSKSMSTSLLSIWRSLSTRMGGPWGRCRKTSSRSYGRCGTSAVSCARSGGTRMGSARIPLSAGEFCDARGTHVQV